MKEFCRAAPIIGVVLVLFTPADSRAQSLYDEFFKEDNVAAGTDGANGDGETVAEVIQAALQHNPQVSIAKAQLGISKAEKLKALGRLLPSIEGSAQYTSDDLRSATIDTLRERDGLTLGLSVRQPIFRGLSTFNTFREQKSLLRASKYLLNDSRSQVAKLAASAHAAVLLSREIVSHRRESSSLLGKQLEITKARMDAGKQSRTGVEQAKMRMEQANVALQAALATLSATEAAFTSIVGHPPLELSPKGIESELLKIESLDDALNSAIYNNPALNAAKETVTAAKHAKRAARGRFSPSVDVEGNFLRRYDQNLGGPVEDEFQVVARMRLPLFEQGQNYAGMKQASSELARQNARLSAAQLEIVQIVTSAWGEMIAAESRQKAAQRGIVAAELSVEGLAMEFEAGRRNVIDVLDGQRDLVDAKISLSQASYDFRIAQYELAAAIGLIAE